MREIKFRAFDTQNKRMYDWKTVRDYPIDYTFNSDIMIPCQYTGLKDCKGKELYEGDMLLCTYGKWHEEPNGLTRVGKVVYDNKACAFKVSIRDSAVLVPIYDTKSKDIEIIGNIYENPELLNSQYKVDCELGNLKTGI